MSFMDKVKQQAEQAMVKAQQGVAQGQTKLNEMQSSKSHDALLRDLGAAYYAQQRSGGSAEAVTSAIEALDAHAAAAAAAATAPPATPGAGAAPGSPAAPPPTGGAATGGGSFGLDDL
jgi:hypothetical protein